MSVRRAGWHVIFGDDHGRWQVGDPGSKRAVAAHRACRFGAVAFRDDVAVLASLRSDFAYLVHDCPTTKLACQKLAALRAAVRKLPEEEVDE